MGLAPMLIQQIFKIISEINPLGTTMLLVEQNAQQALRRSARAYILETGEVVKTGPGPELLADPAIKAAYLGVAYSSLARAGSLCSLGLVLGALALAVGLGGRWVPGGVGSGK